MKNVTIHAFISLVSFVERKLQSGEVNYAAVMRAYSMLALLGTKLREAASENTKTLNKMLSNARFKEYSDRCRSGSGSFRNRTSAERPVSRESEDTVNGNVSEELIETLRQATEERMLLSQDAAVLSALAKRLVKVRKTVLGTKPINEYQADCQSVLLAMEPCQTWQGCLGDKHHYDGVHGSAIAGISNWRVPKAKRTTKKGKLGGKVSLKRGEEIIRRMCNRYVESSCDSLLQKGSRADRFRRLYWYTQGSLARTVVDRLADNGIFIADSSEFPYAIKVMNWLWANTETDIVGTRSEIMLALLKSSLAKHRLYRSQQAGKTDCKPGVSRQIILSDWEDAGSYNLVGTGWFPVVKRQVLCCSYYSGTSKVYQTTEYAFAKQHDREWSETCKLVQTYHASETEDSRFCPVEELGSRLRSAVVRFGHMRSSIQQRRSERARMLVRIRNLETVTVQDSYSSGNCIPGTTEFLRRIGITVESLTGRELAIVWKNSGYIENSLFSRVIDMAERRQNAEKVGA